MRAPQKVGVPKKPPYFFWINKKVAFNPKIPL